MRTLKLSKFFTTFILIVVYVLGSTGLTSAATDAQTSDVIRQSEWDDQESSAKCSGTGSDSINGLSTVSAGPQSPGKVFVLGDSIGEGIVVNGNLEKLLKASDEAWSVKADVRVGRPLKEGIDIVKSSTPPVDLADANYVVVVLGTNPDNSMNADGIKGMVDAIRAVNIKGAPIYWQTVNVTRTNVIDGAAKFNKDLYANKDIKVIQDNVAPKVESGGIHPDNYTPVAKGVADALTSGVEASSSPSATSTPPANMNEDQKIASTFIVGFSDPAKMEAAVKKFHLGGVYVNGTQDAASVGFTKAFFDQLRSTTGGSLLVASDEEGVFKRYTYPGIDFPNAFDMAKKTDAEVEAIGKKVGQAMLSNGVNTDLAPVLDVSKDNLGTDAATAGRAFSNDPAVVTAKAGAFAKGLKSAGVSPVYKHFPGLGSTPGNTDKATQTSPSIEELKKKDLKPFESLLNQNGGAVMLNNASVPGLTEAGSVASTSAATVKLLKEQYKFNGLITTDDLGVPGVGQALPAAIVKSLQAGVDMPLFTYTNDNDIQTAIDAAKAAGINVDANITKSMGAKGTTSTIDSSSECCDIGSSVSSPLIGSGTAEQIWNYLINKETGLGLSNVQAAGVMGNIQQESSFKPDAVNPRSGAYGIIQWIGGRKTKLIALAQSVGKDKSDLAVQLEFLKSELNDQYYKGSVLEPLKATNDLSTATRVWLEHFEIPCVGASAAACFEKEMTIRLPNATAWLNKSGGGAGSSTPATSVGTGASTCGGGGSGGAGASSTGASDVSAYSNPFHDSDGLTQSRIDRGVDYASTKPVPIYAIGNGVVTVATDKSTFYTTSGRGDGTKYSDWITYQLTDGPAKGKYIFVSEACSPIKVKVGDKVTKDTQLCSVLKDSIETGWAQDATTQMPATDKDVYESHHGCKTAYGINFNQLMLKLGAMGGYTHASNQCVQNGGNSDTVLGELPQGWPTW